MKLVNIFIDFKTKHIIKDALPEIKKKLGKFTCKIIPSEKASRKKQTSNQNKRAAIG